jgi:hypothetical protein
MSAKPLFTFPLASLPIPKLLARHNTSAPANTSSRLHFIQAFKRWTLSECRGTSEGFT